MKRVAIIGCGGSGKTYVARALGELLHAPVTHLDAVFYDRDWYALPMPEFEARQRTLVARPSWVIDGNYHATLPARLRHVVFLDLPTASCLWGALWRQLRGGTRQNKATGEYNRIHLGVLGYICAYRRNARPKVLTKITEHASQAVVVQLNTRSHVRRWLSNVAAAQAQT